MKESSSGLLFVYHNFIEGVRKPQLSRKELTSKFENHKLLIFDYKTKSSATILVFPGFSVHGYQDPRILRVASAFARQGIKVIVPQISDLENFKIHPFTLNVFASIIKQVYNDPELNPNHTPIGIFAPSYSGGIALLAAARFMVAPCVSSVCLLGPFNNFKRMVHFATREQLTDNYAKLILLKNFLPHTNHHDDEVVKLLNAAILDNGFNRMNPIAFELLRNASSEQKDLFLKLMYDQNFSRNLIIKALHEIDQTESWSTLFNIEPLLPNIHFTVHLIHGKDDQVIPSSESVELDQLLRSASISCSLNLTSLITHGDMYFGQHLIQETANLSCSFGSFIEDCKKANHPIADYEKSTFH